MSNSWASRFSTSAASEGGLHWKPESPVPQIMDGQVRLGYLLYRSQVQPPYQLIHEPFAPFMVDYVGGEIAGYLAAAHLRSGPDVGSVSPWLAAALPCAQWQGVWDELFQSLSRCHRGLCRGCPARPASTGGSLSRTAGSDYAAVSVYTIAPLMWPSLTGCKQARDWPSQQARKSCSMATTCPKCQAAIRPGARFCSVCRHPRR